MRVDDRHRFSVRASRVERNRLRPLPPGLVPEGLREIAGDEQTDVVTARIDKADGVRALVGRNVDLLRAHEENAHLAVENERTRFARDLHDILGHSLTVITVKAELAGRLLDVDTERARAEITDLERLSRDALADVRRAVEGYRDLTLPGELARARTALAAAEIEAVVPGTTKGPSRTRSGRSATRR